MEYRLLGGSGLKVPVVALGTVTFGGGDPARSWGMTGVEEAKRLVDVALEAGANLFDTADAYSAGRAEDILGQALAGRRDEVLISTKVTFRTEPGPNGLGSSRHHLTRACEASLRRLRTDHIDLYQIHGFDAQTPIEETLRTLDDLVRAGKVRYVGCSNYSGWHLMKSLAIAERYGLPRFVAHQAYYSLLGREYEWELQPLALDQRVGTVVWSPLASGYLSGKFRRDQPPPENSRFSIGMMTVPKPEPDFLYGVVDALDEVARETGKTVAQVSLNWLLRRPTAATVIFGARDERQLRDNLGAADWSLTPEQVAKLDAASEKPKVYPYWHQTWERARPG